ncbi:hypothetical protein DERF_007143 [Dermatophagoides farinae]|uniref:Uncharacterized protein n=1 Tax=Dermatophagoides farinae TaxID=6954 RepID=A0A922L5Q0_DERFA|nr:hypothetical protein DERF_007143 [Dermatophagoides farinae]
MASRSTKSNHLKNKMPPPGISSSSSLLLLLLFVGDSWLIWCIRLLLTKFHDNLYQSLDILLIY